MQKQPSHPRTTKRHFLLLGILGMAATVAQAQVPASRIPQREQPPDAAYPFTNPMQQMPDTFYRGGIRYITLRPFQPWQQPVNDGKTVYLMQAVPQPRRSRLSAEPAHEPPNLPPPTPNEP